MKNTYNTQHIHGLAQPANPIRNIVERRNDGRIKLRRDIFQAFETVQYNVLYFRVLQSSLHGDAVPLVIHHIIHVTVNLQRVHLEVQFGVQIDVFHDFLEGWFQVFLTGTPSGLWKNMTVGLISSILDRDPVWIVKKYIYEFWEILSVINFIIEKKTRWVQNGGSENTFFFLRLPSSI